MNAPLQLRSVAVRRNNRALLEDIDLTIEEGTILALTGPSGSGKTTLLRTMVGLEVPTRGEVLMFGRTVSASNRILVPPERRGIAMVFQDLGLWPHMTVSEHLQFALSAHSLPRSERIARVRSMLQSVGLERRERDRPATLSGGERQRLAFARAVVSGPSLLLLDEPFSNLDIVLKQELLDLLRKLLAERGTAAVLVTHDPREALHLTRYFAILEQGRLTQRAVLSELVASPVTTFTRTLAALLRAGQGDV
jgi:ABC-type Fe3+/spermidine/putrescine transport system ATPase subunit